MDFDSLKDYCLWKPGTSEDFPFNMKTFVFKVGPKIFAFIGLENDPLRVSLKCDPEWAEELRDRYTSVIPGYYMNKRHWNTVILDQNVPDELVYRLIDHSYELVFKKLKKSERESIASGK